jgi:hypothetical protein
VSEVVGLETALNLDRYIATLRRWNKYCFIVVLTVISIRYKILEHLMAGQEEMPTRLEPNLEEIKAMREKMETHHERMEAKIWSEMKTIQEKMGAYQEMMDDGQDEMKAQVGSLASRIDVNQENMIADLDTHQEKMSAKMYAWTVETDACVGKLEARPIQRSRKP